MANNYTQASFGIKLPDHIDIAKIKDAMGLIECFHSFSLSGDETDAHALAKEYDEESNKVLDEMARIIIKNHPKTDAVENESMGFEWKLIEDDEEIWVGHDESIDIDSAVACIQTLALCVPELQKTSPWYATWANTCDKPRIDEFGGGAVVFTATRASWMDASAWRHKELDKFRKQIEKKKQPRKR